MSKVRLSYRQTPRERYHTPMNDEVADLVENYPGIRVIDTSGGAMMSADPEAMVADQSFTIEGDQGIIRGLAQQVEQFIQRPVEIDVV